jgi:ribonuclease HII
MKDSKRFHSKKKIQEVAEYIKANAIAWAVTYEDETTIDTINILQATQQSMHNSILQTMEKVYNNNNNNKKNYKNYKLLIDGNYFKQFKSIPNQASSLEYICIEGGDNKYTAIAAASILAKVARDQYIEELCDLNPELDLHYGIRSNKGYGAKKHLDGIKEHGITVWHRRSFGICKEYV